MSKKKTKSQSPKRSLPKFLSLRKVPRPVVLSVAGVLGIVALCALLLAGFTLRYQNRIYPNTYIGSIDLGGKNTTQAKQILDEKIAQFPKNISILIDTKTHTISASEIKLEYQTEKTIEDLLSIGRVGSFSQNIRELLASTFSKHQRQMAFTLDEAKTDQFLTKIANQTGDLPQDAKVILGENDTVTIQSAKAGNGVLPAQLHANLRTALGLFQTSFEATISPLAPTINDAAAADALTQTQAILAKAPLTFTVGEAKTIADVDRVFSWIAYDVKKSPTQSSGWIPFARATEADTTLVVRLDKDKIKSFVQDFAETINVEPENARLLAVDNKITVVKEHVDGKQVQLTESIDLITSQLTNDSPGALTIALPSATTVAEVRSNNIEELGIRELIGRAETTYKGSPENRQHNIATGARFLNGLLIPPGQEFSTVKTLGKVDGSTGYLPELVIKENKTTPEFGGGLCQVSTTLFRATLNAGLKITERSNHSYRVSYYEPPLGLDATIYLPKPDFKFLNDTPGYILVQNKIEGTKITFELYGTKDGRTSSLSDTQITSTTPAPPAEYGNTDTLAKGVVKQIEKAHDGATTVVNYVVTRNGQEINKQVFRSRYKAWPAKYLVGTREDTPPTTQ
ncbi:MAG TPA: VanW family protein [Patescibacteria group bacterium]